MHCLMQVRTPYSGVCALSAHHLSPVDQTEIVRLSDKGLYRLDYHPETPIILRDSHL